MHFWTVRSLSDAHRWSSGRYFYLKDKWAFEKGDFTRNACYNLRLEFILSTTSTNH